MFTDSQFYVGMAEIYFLLSFTKNTFHELKIKLEIILILFLNETTIKKTFSGGIFWEVSLPMPKQFCLFP